MWSTGLLLVAVLVASCDGGGNPNEASCTQEGNRDAGVLMLCEEFTGLSSDGFLNESLLCASYGGHFAGGRCPRAGALAGCRQESETTVYTYWYYDDGSGLLSLEDVQQECAAFGGVTVLP